MLVEKERKRLAKISLKRGMIYDCCTQTILPQKKKKKKKLNKEFESFYFKPAVPFDMPLKACNTAVTHFPILPQTGEQQYQTGPADYGIFICGPVQIFSVRAI